MEKHAIFSPSCLHRYKLWRIREASRPVVFAGPNPAATNETRDGTDPVPRKNAGIMYSLFLVSLFISTPASASGLEGFLKNVVKAAVQDIEQEGRTGQSQPTGPTTAPIKNGQPLTVEDREREIVTAADCMSRPGGQSSNQAAQACIDRHYAQCLDLLASLPISKDGEEKFEKFFNDHEDSAKCASNKMALSANRQLSREYGASARTKKSEFEQYKKDAQESDCMSRIDAIPIADGGSKQINELPSYCSSASHEFKEKRDNKQKRISAIEAESQTKKYSGLIDKYKKIAQAPPSILSADIIVQWGGNNFGPLIKFIDTVQNSSLSKAKYEMKGKSLVIRHRITDPATSKSGSLIYVFTPFPELPPGEILLTRIVSEKSSMGGLVKEQEEVDAKQIGTVFALVYAGMIKEQSK